MATILPYENPEFIYEGVSPASWEPSTGTVFNRAPKQILANIKVVRDLADVATFDISALSTVVSTLNTSLSRLKVPKTSLAITGNTVGVANTIYTITSMLTLSLPPGNLNDEIVVIDRSGTGTVVIAPAVGDKIESLAQNLVLDYANSTFTLTFIDAQRGWIINGAS